ncbi:hypothetical protein [Cardiobacterium valvarum]|uniref:Uncharacterized protein n=1 Tax=Cardiobacterium valvarum TaxID=194702 RepID=A0A381ED48_9GAMM|nr:hypothetical protein [Cardiobacterium valvarum]SUX24803.1 Uncharacterised protein [Cardiobacterium valvarum]
MNLHCSKPTKRLVRSYQRYVKDNISPCTPFGGMRAPFSVAKRKTHTQKLSRFLKNLVISIEKPSTALIPGTRDNISRHAAKHIPVAHDWSRIGVEHKNKTNTLSRPSTGWRAGSRKRGKGFAIGC